METKAKEPFLKNLKNRLHLENVFTVPTVNSSGGLDLYWKNGIDLYVLNASPTFIDVVVNPGVDGAWQFTGFYGNPVTANWEHS